MPIIFVCGIVSRFELVGVQIIVGSNYCFHCIVYREIGKDDVIRFRS
jgi:hypothetical protein